ATAVMAGSLPAGPPALVVLEVPEPADQQPIDSATPVTIRWLARAGRPAGEPAALVEAVRTLPLPDGPGHAYLAGEARVVSALRDVLTARGLTAGQISPKAYWGRGRANAGHGEPAGD
ncbi:MAG TPA: siderophore-interacting protein, partial [Mycobacteriales bacterium]|nr:siderophore-interacting protein [Mycobacteriales bacterium]